MIKIQPSKTELQDLVKLLRAYGSRLLEGLLPENLHWVPPKTQGKPIIYYFAHILNAEIYWLHHLGDKTLAFVEKDATFQDGLALYKKLEIYLLEKIANSTEEDLQLQAPISENKEFLQRGKLGWMIWRTSMHAIHHFGQIAYIRYALGNPPAEDGDYTWSKVMDAVVAIAHRGKVRKISLKKDKTKTKY